MGGFYAILGAVGVFMIAAAVFNWDAWFYDAESRLVEAVGGENAVRWYWGVSGAVLVVWSAVAWARG